MLDLLHYPADQDDEKFAAIIGRRCVASPDIAEAVRHILEEVRLRGDAALIEFTRKFDEVEMTADRLRVSALALDLALETLEPELHQAILAATENIRAFHGSQDNRSWFVEDGDGVILGKKTTPIRRVGICAPAGEVPLFSSLIMAAVPAQIAGVEEICVVSPPQRDGKPHPTIMAVARLLNIDEVYALGGAQAVGALAFGTGEVRSVDKVVGPGSPYTVAAQQQVYGRVGIALLPGPSEIVVLADDSADAGYVAADLLSQAEHGWESAAICITPSLKMAEAVRDKVKSQVSCMPRAEVVEVALRAKGCVVHVSDLASGIELANEIAPEHLELQVHDPWAMIDRVRHAGAVFLGSASAEPVGDYFAGTNHILPVGGAARFASSLGVGDFVKDTSIIAYSQKRLARVGSQIETLARAEGLEAHARAVSIRLDARRSES